MIKDKINSKQKLLEWCEQLVDYWTENKYINVTASVQRSLDQNALIHSAIAIVAEVRGDLSTIELKREFKLDYGTHILRRDDPMYNWIYGASLDKLDRERQLKIMDAFQVTSLMSTTQLTEFYEQICRDYTYVPAKIEEMKTARSTKKTETA